MALPNFFLIGAPKAGTTALHSILARHPEIGMSAVKEPKFFLADERPPPPSPGPGDRWVLGEYVWQREAYESLFSDVADRPVRGESSPFYLYDRLAQARLKRLVPDARLVAVLRQPEDRAHSNWAHMSALGREPVTDFLAACDAEEERRAAGWEPFWYYKSLGLYGQQLSDLLTIFRPDQLEVVLYEDFQRDPDGVVNRICRFLGVAEDAVAPESTRRRENQTEYVPPTMGSRALRGLLRQQRVTHRLVPPRLRRWGRALILEQLKKQGTSRPEPTEHERRTLRQWYRDDLAVLSSVVDVDLSAWAIEAPHPRWA